MDLAILVLTAIGAAAAIAAAWFGFLTWHQRRLKPKLALGVRDVAPFQQSRGFTVNARLELVFRNTGKGAARNWRLELAAPAEGEGDIDTSRDHPERPGHWYRLAERRRAVEWRAADTNEVIPAGGIGPGLGPFTVLIDPDEKSTVCDYTLTADLMKPRSGTITLYGQGPRAEVR